MIEIVEAYPFVKVLKYLTLLRKKFEKTKGGVVVIEEVNGEEYRVVIKYLKPWIRIYLPLGNLKEFPEDKRKDVMEKLLQLTFEYAEVSFGIDEEGNIFAVEDIYQEALTMDVFEEEYGAVPFAVELFKKEVMPLKEEK